MAYIRAIHWAVPVTMLTALLSGALLALGHHLFYTSLAGRTAPTGSYSIVGADVSKQQFNTAVGTAFAFLVKALLALAVGVAYTQVFWRAAGVTRDGTTLSRLDALHSILNNIVCFLKAKVWWRHPVLLSLAIVAWAIPIASIVTPATLSVDIALANPPPSVMAQVPAFDFVNLDFAAGMTAGGPQGLNYSEYCYEGPSQVLQRIATSVSAQGQLLPIQAPTANASWTADFWAPSLQCSSVTGPQLESVWDSVFKFTNNMTRCKYSYAYLSWVERSEDDILPFAHHDGSYGLVTVPNAPNTPAAIYLATIPQMALTLSMGTDVYPGGCMLATQFQMAKNVSEDVAGDSGLGYFTDATLLRCEVRNSSYTAAFNYTNGEQSVNVDKQPSQALPLLPVGCVTGPEDPYQPYDTGRYWSALDNMQNQFCSTLNIQGTQCLFDPVIAERLSYQSIVAAFNERVSGSIGLGSPSSVKPSMTFNSAIGQSVLMNTEELGFVTDWHIALDFSHNDSSKVWPNLQTIVQMSKGESLRGLVSPTVSGARGGLGPALEQLFENITLSILSEPYLQPNVSALDSLVPLTNVTIETFDNVYVYAAQTLWIAYGLAILFAMLAVGIGLVAMSLNGVAYEDSFSTVLRVGRAAALSDKLTGSDGNGAAPLPAHLKQARLLLPASSSKAVGSGSSRP